MYLNVRKVDDTESKVSRNSLGLSFDRFFASRYFGRITSSFEGNSELDLDLRILLGGGIGRYFIQSNHNLLSCYLGLTSNMEWFSYTDSRADNLEGVISVSYEWFRYVSPELDLESSLSAYPSLTEGKRWRIDLDTRFSYEIVKDLTVSLGIYDNYDSAPLGGESSTNDLGISTALGWKIK
jgi:hypothetical protein